MRVWFSKNLGDGILAVQPLGHIQEQFRSAYTNAGSPEEMALFVRHESAGRLHCDVTIYLSPASARVAEVLGATPCARPSAGGLSLLVGSDEAWSVLFPER
jgi:hypothetical protein